MPPEAKAEQTDSPEVAALRFKETTLKNKIDRLQGMDQPTHSKLVKAGHEVPTAISNAVQQLAEVRAEIKRLTK